MQVGQQCDMDKDRIFMSDIMLELTDSFKERLALNITDSTAHFNDSDTGIRVCEITVKTVLDFVGDVRDNLYCASAKVAAALFLQYRPVNFTGCDIGIFIQAFVDESLVVAEIQVGLTAIVSDKDLAVLNRVHGAGVDVDVGVKFLHGDFVSAGL